jgi:pyridoxine 5-phosphate synthase
MTARTKLSVNVNKIATLRNARGGDSPSVVHAARTCIDAGCHGITVHPRPDGRHVRHQDVYDLADMLTVEFNIEGYPAPEFLDLVLEVKPDQCTLVPDPPGVLTSNAGWDLRGDRPELRAAIRRLQDAGVRVSIFLEADPTMVDRAKEIGADRIELYTESYARDFGTPNQGATFAPFVAAATRAAEFGLGLNAGHDLDQRNLAFFASNIPGLLEVSIGHALISEALYDGLDATVRTYLRALGW